MTISLSIDPRRRLRAAVSTVAVVLVAVLLIIQPPEKKALAAGTTIDVTAQQSPPPFWTTTQVALTAAESQVNLTNRVPTTWVSVQIFSPSAWTWRAATGVTTTAFPVLANQVITVYVTGLGQTFFPVGSGNQTLYVVPVTTVKPTY